MDHSLNTDIEVGLREKQVEERLLLYGLNQLKEETPPTSLEIFLQQFRSPLVYVLLSAFIVTALLHHYSDAFIIGLAVVINTVLGFIQESKASNALAALKKLVHPHVRVIRDRQIQTIEIENLVPGDIVLLRSGDRVPADGKLVYSNRFFVNESMLTGESFPVDKHEDAKVFMGTSVTAGNAKMMVTITGEETEMGKIAESVVNIESDTPLKRQLSDFSRKLSILIVVLILIVFLEGVLTGQDLVEFFLTAVALAVSAIPEGLLVALTVILTVGMQRILKRKGLIKNLISAETLGSVTTICIDKTGTLTEGNMRVVDVLGNKSDLALQMLVANDKDDPIVLAGWAWAEENMNTPLDVEKYHERYDSLPFSSYNKFFASLNKFNDESNIVFVNGAPEIILERTNLVRDKREEIENQIDKLSKSGKRVLGFARKVIGADVKTLSENMVEKDLEWVGLLGFSDPLRHGVKEALEKTRAAGIKLIVITGDYRETAKAVLGNLGVSLLGEDIIVGGELEKLTDRDISAKLFANDNIKLFARTKPDQKLKIVSLLKSHGEVIAMMGDGVNDAPALAKADIGIVVNEATDVARESAELVLLDSNYSTIVSAIEEGRAMFDNIRKVILYLMSDAFEEILLILLTIIFGLPLPVTAAQILWINLVSDGFPDLALTVDPKVSNIMKRGPRKPNEPLISRWMYKIILAMSVTGSVLAFLVYEYVYTASNYDLAFARSVVFATVGLNSLIYVFSVKTLRSPFWESNPFSNKWLILAVLVGGIFQILPFVVAPLGVFLGVVPIGGYWIFPSATSLIMFFSVEIFKKVLR